jgi:hypothetical protein
MVLFEGTFGTKGMSLFEIVINDSRKSILSLFKQILNQNVPFVPLKIICFFILETDVPHVLGGDFYCNR